MVVAPPDGAVVAVPPPEGVVVAPPGVIDVCGAPEDCDAADVALEPPAVLPVVLPVLDGFVVLDDARSFVFLPPRSPGWVMASPTPATTTTIAAINRSDVRCFSRETSSWERVTGVEPASPAWKAGALPLSYTRVDGWNVVGRT